MNLLDSNRQVIERYIQEKGIAGLLEGNSNDFESLSAHVQPQSMKARFAKRFARIVSPARLKQLLVDETRRLFNRFLKEWASKMVVYASSLRQASLGSSSSNLELARDSSLVSAELEHTLQESRRAELTSKKVAFIPTHDTLHPLVLVKDSQEKVASVFKVLSGRQMAGELISYFLGLFCGVDFFHCVVPSYCWVDGQGRGEKARTMGILSSFHEGSRTVYELFCSKSKGLEALQKLPDEYVQGICLMHMLRGSEDAHIKNTLVQTLTDPRTGEEVITKIIEIDGEHVMSSSEPRSDRYDVQKDVASLRIWWLGLPQADKPLNRKMLELIQTWTRDKLMALHAQLGLFSDAKVRAQLWRLELMRMLARDSVMHNTELSARGIFARLIYDHPTLMELQRLGKDPLAIYNAVGSVSTEELSPDSDGSFLSLEKA